MNAGSAVFGSEMRGPQDLQFGQELLRIFWRRRLLIVATVIVISAAALAYALTTPPLYKATASIIVATSSVTRLGTDVIMPMAQDETVILSQSEILASRGVAREVAIDLNLVNDREFNPAATRKPVRSDRQAAVLQDTIDELLRHIDVRRDGRSAIVLLTASSTSPEKAALIANKFLANHLAMQRSERAATSRSTAAQLRPQVEKLRQQVIDGDRRVAEYRRVHNITGPIEGPDMSQIGRLSGNLSDARSSSTEAAARASAAMPTHVGTGDSAATSPLLNDLRRQSAELGKRVAELSAFYGPGYPELVNATAQLADVNRRVTDEAARVARDLRSEVSIGHARESQISSDLSRIRGQSFAERSATVQLLDLQREADANRAIYVDLLQRLRQLEGQSQLYQVPAKIFARATTPDEPSYPHPKEIVGVAALGSFVLGLVLAFALELVLERRIRTGEQVERLLGTPTLGMIPFVAAQPGEALYRTLASNPTSVFSEAARSLFLEVCQRVPMGRSPVVLVTSPLPGEGKTTLALSLGAAAAQWRKTVVVDLDLRRPGVIDLVGAPRREADLTTYLRGAAGFEDIIVADPSVERLFVIGLDRRADNPAVLLSNPLLRRLIDELRERFDFVVITAPPLLAVRDAKTLSSFANATLLVLRWGKTHTEAMLAAARFFGKPFTGIVINQVDFAKHARSAQGDMVQHHYACSGYYADEPRRSAIVNA